MLSVAKPIFVIFLLVVCFLVNGQHNYKQFYTQENLRSKELIKSVSKDSLGYVWIATDAGILRYDGFKTKVFFTELPTHYTKGFLRTRNGRFFVYHDFGINEIITRNDSVIFKPFSFNNTTYNHRLNYPKSAFEDADGNIWVGESHSVTRYGANGFKRYELGDQFNSIDYHRNFSFAEDAFGHVWIAPFKGPILFYDKRSQELKPVKLSHQLSEVGSIAVAKGDYLLIGGKEGMIKVKVDSDNKILDEVFLGGITGISTLRCIHQSEVFIGTWQEGLFYYDFDQGVTHRVGVVPINDVYEIFFDEPKNELWVAGSENVGLFKPSMVTSLQAVGEHRIESIALGKSDIFYSVGKQVYRIDDLDDKQPENLLTTTETYFSRIDVENNKLWVGDAFNNIYYFTLPDKTRHQVLRKQNNYPALFIFTDHNHNKWFCGFDNGLVRVDPFEKAHDYSDLKASVIARESKSGMIISGQSDIKHLLARYNPLTDKFDNVALNFTFPCESIILNDLQFDSHDNIWLATNEGLLKVSFEDNHYTNVERVTIPGMNQTDAIRAIAISNDNICFANSNELVLYKDGQYLLFNQEAGLPSKILKERGLIFDQHEDLLIATAKGLAVIKKDAIQFEKTRTPVFELLDFNGMNEFKTDNHKFPYKSKLEAEFVSLSFPTSNIQYQTKIVGIDNDWSTPSLNRSVNVLGFSEGTYTLLVRARENGKLWSNELSYTFEIKKPWYRQWWAIALFVVFAIAVVIVSTAVHNNNLIRQKRNLEKVVDERTDEINRQKNELIEQQKKIIQQKEEIITKNETVYKSQQALNEADMNYLQLKERQLQEQIEYKNKQITTHALNILQKNETLTNLRNQLEEIVKNSQKISITEIRKTLKTIDESFKLDKDWDDFKLYFEQIHTGFYAKLKASYPDLTPLELRHCALIRLNLTLAECASILGISHDSIKVSRTRLRKKLNLDASQSLTDFILGL